MENRKIEKIILRKDLWPRFELNVKLVQRYKDCLDMLPPVDINQNDILIDGYHRLMAFKSEKREEIPCNTIQTESERQILKLAIQKNATFGKQLSPEEKKKWAIEFIGEMSIEKLANLLSVTPDCIAKWTKNKRDQLKNERDQNILKLYLRAWNNQESIAKEIGCHRTTVGEILQTFEENNKFLEIPQAFKPQLYDIWNYRETDNQIKYPGNIPQDIIEQLLYYYTEPFDIVFDPFGGGGITIDACKKWYRRYYVSDINILPEREEDMRKWDLTKGIPPDLPQNSLKPKLIFMDPPYWSMKKDDYIKGSISDLSLEDYYKFIEGLAKNCYEAVKKKGIIAFIIQNQTEKDLPNGYPIIHTFECAKRFENAGLRLIREINCPQSTQCFLPQQVEKAQKEKRMLGIVRDLLIFKKEEKK